MKLFCFEITYIGIGKKKWQKIADSGLKIEAIKEYRKANTKRRFGVITFIPDLRQSKDAVDSYLANGSR